MRAKEDIYDSLCTATDAEDLLCSSWRRCTRVAGLGFHGSPGIATRIIIADCQLRLPYGLSKHMCSYRNLAYIWDNTLQPAPMTPLSQIAHNFLQGVALILELLFMFKYVLKVHHIFTHSRTRNTHTHCIYAVTHAHIHTYTHVQTYITHLCTHIISHYCTYQIDIML